MKNLKVSVSKDGICTVTFDTKAIQGPSKSGKTALVASSEGNIEVPGCPGLKLGVNAYTALPEA